MTSFGFWVLPVKRTPLRTLVSCSNNIRSPDRFEVTQVDTCSHEVRFCASQQTRLQNLWKHVSQWFCGRLSSFDVIRTVLMNGNLFSFQHTSQSVCDQEALLIMWATLRICHSADWQGLLYQSIWVLSLETKLPKLYDVEILYVVDRYIPKFKVTLNQPEAAAKRVSLSIVEFLYGRG